MKCKKSKAVIFANIVLNITAIIFILAIYYLWYKSNSGLAPHKLQLLVISIAGLLFSIVTLCLRDSWKINIAIAIFSIVVATYGIEVVLFVHYNSGFLQVKIDKRTIPEVLNDLRDEGVDAWPHVSPLIFIKSNGLLYDNNRIFPLGGISKKTTVLCNEGGQYPIYESDEYGFNNLKGLYKEDFIKAALVGDSFTIGHCINRRQNIAGQLRNMGINAINFGFSGNGPLIELAVFKEYVEPLQPKIVLWVYYDNDIHDLERESKASILMRYLQDDYSQNLLERQEEIDAALIKFVTSKMRTQIGLEKQRKNHKESLAFLIEAMEKRPKIIKLWYVRNRLGLASKQFIGQNDEHKPNKIPNYETLLSLFSEILAAANQRSSGWGGKLYFVYLPTMSRYVHDGKYAGNLYDSRDDVLDILHKLGIELIDFHEVLSSHPDPLSLTPYVGAHFNAAGYKLIAELIVSKLKKDGLISKSERQFFE